MAKKTSPHAKMLNLVIGHWVARLIQVAATLNIADLLKRGPRTAKELAAATNVRAPQLYRVLRALASVGVFAETKNGRFKLTPLARTLQTGVPGSMRTAALMLNSDWQWDAWQKLLAGIETDDVPFVKAHGMSVFEYLEKHPDDLAAFHDSATGLTNPSIAAAYNFSKFRTLVDVGGSHGGLLATILKANPSLNGVLFDQPSVIAHARKSRYLADREIAKRCRLESGSFFDSVPAGADAYILKYILHDWDDEQCVKILSNCRTAMGGNGRVLVVDSVVPPGNEPGYVKLLDIEMLVIGGRERTKADFASIFQKSGLKLTKVLATKSPLSIVEGIRA